MLANCMYARMLVTTTQFHVCIRRATPDVMFICSVGDESFVGQSLTNYVMSDHVWQDNMYAYMEADEFYEPPELANYFKEPLFSILF